jgi:hypothetical protein
MKLDEAVAIRQDSLHGKQVAQHLLDQAMRRIDLGNTIALGQRDVWRPERISETQRTRINEVLAYRLALACGLLNKWKARP